MINILDIGTGNIRSIENWIEKANVAYRVVHHASDIKCNLLIIPGVGSVGPYMSRIRKGSFDDAIVEHVDNGGRLLGICLGFQIMGASSEEDGGVECLGLLDGRVEKLSGFGSHNSWEPLYLRRDSLNNQNFNSEFRLSRKKILSGRVFYNHEYGFINSNPKVFSIPISDNFSDYSGLVIKNKIIGLQFHPEKSQRAGQQLISMIL